MYVKDEKPMLFGYSTDRRFLLVDGTAPAGQLLRQWPFAEHFAKLFPFVTSQGELLVSVSYDRPGGLGIRLFGTPIKSEIDILKWDIQQDFNSSPWGEMSDGRVIFAAKGRRERNSFTTLGYSLFEPLGKSPKSPARSRLKAIYALRFLRLASGEDQIAVNDQDGGMRLFRAGDLSPVQDAAAADGGIGHYPGFFSDPSGGLYYGGNVGNELVIYDLAMPRTPIFKTSAGTQQNSQSWVTLANGEVVAASYVRDSNERAISSCW